VFDPVQTDPGRWMAIRWPRTTACGWQRRLAGGDAVAAAADGERRRNRENDAGVHHSTRGWHQDDGTRSANTTGGFRGGDVDAQRLTASSGSGGAPARTSRRRGARVSNQTAPKHSLPRGVSTEQHQDDRTAAEARVQHGGRLGFERRRRRALGLLGFWVRGPGGAAAAL
jgi:hypothetical protein